MPMIRMKFFQLSICHGHPSVPRRPGPRWPVGRRGSAREPYRSIHLIDCVSRAGGRAGLTYHRHSLLEGRKESNMTAATTTVRARDCGVCAREAAQYQHMKGPTLCLAQHRARARKQPPSLSTEHYCRLRAHRNHSPALWLFNNSCRRWCCCRAGAPLHKQPAPLSTLGAGRASVFNTAATRSRISKCVMSRRLRLRPFRGAPCLRDGV
jgi:hypothetical protein